jgi:predicted ArsR family transcriptional regulator
VASAWNDRFLATTRGQVVLLLRQGPATVEDLAGALGLTDNAVRSHLAALERDRLVAQHGLRRGVGKPAHTYALTAEAEGLFPKAYGVVLRTLLDVLAEQLPEADLDGALLTVGRHLAREHRRPGGELRERVAAGAALIGDLGGLATVEEQPDRLVISGRSCPLATAVEGHPETCLLAEALLAEYIGAPVTQVCDPVALRCRFEVPETATPA